MNKLEVLRHLAEVAEGIDDELQALSNGIEQVKEPDVQSRSAVDKMVDARRRLAEMQMDQMLGIPLVQYLPNPFARRRRRW